MQDFVPHLWYDKEAKEAALLYISLFEESKLLSASTIENTPSGNTEIVSFELAGQQFSAISAGPYFKFNPSISLMVSCSSAEEVDAKWRVLSEGGIELMPLGEYPFSKRYAWIQDRYGLSWQLMLVADRQITQKISPNFLFSSDACGKAEEAVRYYTEVFEESAIDFVSRYANGEAASQKAKINFAAFRLFGYEFSAMDNGYDVDYGFNEAFSIMLKCSSQKEIDYYWDKLSAVPEAEQCGWVKDKFGVSWQIVPHNLDEIFSKGTREEINRVTHAFLKMKKFDLEALEKARLGNL